MNCIRTLFIYNNDGVIVRAFNAEDESAKTYANGLPYIIVDVPDGVIIKSIDVSTLQPVYDTDSTIISEINKLSAKMDYIAMKCGINMANVCDVLEGNVGSVIDGTSDTHSANYSKVYYYYLTGLWNINAVVEATTNSWITKVEYNAIIKAKEAQNVANTNNIPVVVAQK